MLFCVFCSPKSSTVVLACFCRVLCDFPLSHFGHPPNMVTCVRPGPKLKAVAVWYIRGCACSGRVSWEEIWSWWYWLTSLLEANINMYCKLSRSSHLFITTHLPPPPRVEIQDPYILQSVVLVISSPNDQQLGVLLSIVETTGSMRGSFYWAWGSLRSLQFGPFLGQVTQHTHIHMMSAIMELITSYSVFTIK